VLGGAALCTAADIVETSVASAVEASGLAAALDWSSGAEVAHPDTTARPTCGGGKSDRPSMPLHAK
jgi:hypothetical protein